MPVAQIKLEVIAENYFDYRKRLAKGEITTPDAATEHYGELLGRDKSQPWVARIIGPDEKYSLRREFIRGRKDYSLANSIGSRGVYLYFYLSPGVYEVNERSSWTRVRRYFCRVEGTEVKEMTREEVDLWLQESRPVCILRNVSANNQG